MLAQAAAAFARLAWVLLTRQLSPIGSWHMPAPGTCQLLGKQGYLQPQRVRAEQQAGEGQLGTAQGRVGF